MTLNIPPCLRYALLSLFILFFTLEPTSAQEGNITGTVVDSESGEILIGASVIIDGTTTGTTTDLDGHYELGGLEPAIYDIRFSYIGNNTKTVQHIRVEHGKRTRLDISLTPESIGMEEIIVEARSVQDTEAALLRARQKAAAVSDAISAEAISKSGSSDAADAMEKVTGASVVDGKYVFVRGLGERYSSTQLNGVELPTADPDKRAVQFDLFPSNLLDNIVTIKTFTPDKPGNFSGGLVDIGTKSLPERLSVQFSASTSINTQTTFNEHYLTYPGGSLDWLARDDRTRDIPDILADPNVEIPSPQRARFDPKLAENLDQFSKAFNTGFDPITRSAPANQSYSLSAGNQVSLFGNPLGVIVSGTYNQSYTYYGDGFAGRYAFSGAGAPVLSPDLLLEDKRGIEEVSLGGLAYLSYRPGKNSELGLNTMYSRTGTSEARLQTGLWEELDIDDPNSLFINRVLGWTERRLFSVQFRGRHRLETINETEVVWSTAHANTFMDEPDRRYAANTRRLIAGEEIHTWTASGFRDPSRLFRRLDENNYDLHLDVSTPFRNWNGQRGNLKIGGAYQRVNRDFRERAFEFVPSPFLPQEDHSETFFSYQNMGIVATDTLSTGRIRYTFGNVVRDASKMKNNYRGLKEVAAGFFMFELPIVRRVRAVGGARLESTLMKITSRDTLARTGGLENLDLLPSINLVYQLQDNMNLRAAVTRTIARPTFREIAPFESFEFLLGNYFIGNTNLRRTNITNYDLRWEWFTRPGEIFAISLFYKNLFDPIERAIIGGTNGQIQYYNVPEARIYGAEFELRKRLDQMFRELQYLSVGLNVSLIQSTIDIPGEYNASGDLIGGELFMRRQYDPEAEKRGLQGQSPYLINADLSYENSDSGTNAAFYFNVFGARLSQVSLGPTPDVFERPQPMLDFTFSQRVFSDWAIKLSAKNLLDTDYKETYRWNGNDFIYHKYARGRTFSLGIVFTPSFGTSPSPGHSPSEMTEAKQTSE